MSFFKMMVEIVKIVLVPIGAALIHDHLKHGSNGSRKILLGVAAFSVAWLAFLALGGWEFLQAKIGRAHV